MKKNLLLALVGAAFMFAFVGCTPTEATTPKEDTSATTVAEKVKCDACGKEFDKSAIKEVDGKMVCVNCAEMHDGKHDADMFDCACGKQIARADAVDVDGKPYCKDCAAKMGKGDVPTDTGDHEHKEGETH
jgi:hypothetical protein